MDSLTKHGGRRLQGYNCRQNPDLPVITIITVVFNGALYLEQAIKSVIDQNYPNLEYIIIDGGSKDNSIEIIQKYADCIDFWVSEPDAGLYFAMNKGINYASGQWIGTKNADDFYTPNALLVVAEAIINHPNTDVFYGDTLQIWQENPLKTSVFSSCHRRIGKDGGIDHRTVFVRSGLHKKNLFDTTLRLSADYDLFCRLKLQNVVFGHVGACISYKRAGGVSSSNRILAEAFSVNKKHFGLLHALRIWAKVFFRRYTLKIWNGLLRSVLSEQQFSAFKSREK